MESISKFMTEAHRRCDADLSLFEAAVASAQWARATQLCVSYETLLLQHLDIEEQIFFPAYEERSGNRLGPTEVMRGDHRHIERLMRALRESLAQEDTEQSLGISESLLVLLQQHNVKEEQVLYPILDRLLADEHEALLQAAHRVPPRATETPPLRAE